MNSTTLELMALTALSALACSAAFAMDYITVGSVFAAITLSVVIISVMVSPVD
jgi:hypothetical protein